MHSPDLATIDRRAFLGGLVLSLLAGPIGRAADAQEPKAGKVYRIGFMSMRSGRADNPQLDAFQQGLREMGYLEGRNVVLEIRYAKGDPRKLPGLAAEMVRL